MTVRRVNSSEFRVTYVRLEEPVAVTVLDRVIGYYIPGGILDTIRVADEDFIVLRPTPRPGQQDPSAGAVDGGAGRTEAPAVAHMAVAPHSSPPVAEQTSAAATPKGPGAPADGSTAGMSQTERDRVLAKVRKGR